MEAIYEIKWADRHVGDVTRKLQLSWDNGTPLLSPLSADEAAWGAHVGLLKR